MHAKSCQVVMVSVFVSVSVSVSFFFSFFSFFLHVVSGTTNPSGEHLSNVGSSPSDTPHVTVRTREPVP